MDYRHTDIRHYKDSMDHGYTSIHTGVSHLKITGTLHTHSHPRIKPKEGKEPNTFL